MNGDICELSEIARPHASILECGIENCKRTFCGRCFLKHRKEKHPAFVSVNLERMKEEIRRRCHPSSILGEILTVVDLDDQSDDCLEEFLDMLKTPATDALKKELGGK